MKLAFRIAVICGALPLLTGISIFLLWLVTRWEFLEMAGLLTIFVGFLMFIVGILALARFYWVGQRTPDYSRRRMLTLTIMGACLLLINLPMALGITVAVIKIETSYIVIVQNRTEQKLENVNVSGGGCDETVDVVKPGHRARFILWFAHDDELQLRANMGTTQIDETIDGYVTNGMGGRKSITVNPDGTVSVSDSNW